MTKQESMIEGKNVEKYISKMVCDKNCIDVTTDNDYCGVDFLIYGEGWDVKNAWHTENGGNKTLRESRNIKKWHRKNKDGTFNWHLFPYKSHLLSENGFLIFCGETKRIETLESFFG
jgi:hypothetical protein|tara:strand:- start:103 stop:453 length:351 start_codon:yes stop_codon:yes gene_type:complete